MIPTPAGEVYTKTSTTNLVGTACLTEALLPQHLHASSSSPSWISLTEGLNRQGMLFHADLQAYMSSKAAVNRMASFTLACPRTWEGSSTWLLRASSRRTSPTTILQEQQLEKEPSEL